MNPKRLNLLFVCVENSNRSQMAEGFARHLGGSRVMACSAGSRPSGIIHPKAIAAMKEKGIDLTVQQSKGLSELPETQWDWIVTMGCGDACPSLPARNRADWALPDPKHLPPEQFNVVRDEIERRVIELLKKAEH
jgi:arsenate reductase (thioredoxin)